jgi:putative ABC transport system substrate-binding protein
VGFIVGGGFPTMIAAFRDTLRELGYVEGEDLVLEMRLSRPNTPDLPDLVAELAQLDLDLMVAASLPVALEVRKVMPAMPMVIATCPDMVSNGFAQSLERPGGNVTGLDELPPGVTARRLELLRTAAPQISRVALLSTTPGRGGHERQLADAQEAAGRSGVLVKPYRVTARPELEPALAEMVDDGMNALLNFQGALSLVNRKLIVEFAAKHRMPAIYQATLFAEAGGLMAWAPDINEQFRVAARYADKILKGARPGDLAIQHPSRYFLTINKSAAKAIGLSLPADLLARADRILE